MACRPLQEFETAVDMLHQCSEAFHPVPIIAIQDAVDFPHFRTMDMSADHALVPAPACLCRYSHLEIHHVVERFLDLALEVRGQRPVGQPHARAQRVEVSVEFECELIQVVANVGQPLGALDDYPMVWETLKQVTAATLHPLAVDREGARVEDLEALLEQGTIQLLVLSPQCQFPTGVPLAQSRRERFLELSRQHRFPILELDTEHDYLATPGNARRPMASGNQGQVLYTGSLSRLLAPGVRVSFLTVPEHLADPATSISGCIFCSIFSSSCNYATE